MKFYLRGIGQWHPTPVLLPGKSHGQRSLIGYSPWGHKESDMTERLHFHFHFMNNSLSTLFVLFSPFTLLPSPYPPLICLLFLNRTSSSLPENTLPHAKILPRMQLGLYVTIYSVHLWPHKLEEISLSLLWTLGHCATGLPLHLSILASTIFI